MKERLNRLVRRVTKLYYWLRIAFELRTEQVPCPVCGSKDRTELPHRERFGFGIHFVSCASCGLVQQKKVPTEQFLNRFYARDYYRGLYWGSHQAPKGDLERRKALATVRASQLREDVSLPSAPTIFDYGAGVGTLKSALLKHWPFASVLEADPGTMDSVLPQGAQADLITVVHVLEHLHDPRKTVSEFKGLLKNGGMLYIEVPDLNVLTARDYHIAHVWYFSEQTLSNLLTDLGFTIVNVRHDRALRAFSILASL